MTEQMGDSRFVAVVNDQVESQPVHVADCYGCRWREKFPTWAKAMRETAAHIEGTGHSAVMVQTHRFTQVMACPPLSKYVEHPRRVRS